MRRLRLRARSPAYCARPWPSRRSTSTNSTTTPNYDQCNFHLSLILLIFLKPVDVRDQRFDLLQIAREQRFRIYVACFCLLLA